MQELIESAIWFFPLARDKQFQPVLPPGDFHRPVVCMVDTYVVLRPCARALSGAARRPGRQSLICSSAMAAARGKPDRRYTRMGLDFSPVFCGKMLPTFHSLATEVSGLLARNQAAAMPLKKSDLNTMEPKDSS